MRYLIIIITIFLSIAISSNAKVRYELNADNSLMIMSSINLLNQVGVKEKTGHNDGKEIAMYLKSVGINKPASYCAAGQYWCFAFAVDMLCDVEIPVPKTGVAIKFMQYAMKHGEQTEYKPKVHDLIVWKKRNSWQGHIERIVDVLEDGYVVTVGFNTSNGLKGSQREGNGVFPRVRNIYHGIGSLQVFGLVGFKTTGELK